MAEKKSSDQPLSEEEAENLLGDFHTYKRRAQRPAKTWCLLAVLGSLGVAVYTWLVVVVTRIYGSQCTKGPTIIPNIARDAIKFEPYYFVDHHEPDHPLFGSPSSDLDQAWEELLQWSELRVPENEIQRLEREVDSVHLADGGYFGMFTAHHHLHCLMRIHHHSYLDYYFPNMTDAEAILEAKHTRHCLDTIKQAIMCQGDTTLLTMRWTQASPVPSANWSTPHTCVNWSQLDQWAEDHWVDVRAEGMLVHPQFGPVFHDRKNNASRIGVATPN